MKVCVGIVTRGRAELAEKAVASALAQIPPPKLVWVIEDGVVGKPFEWKQGGPVKITRKETSLGYMAARQKMMMEADAEVYVSLDDDAWFLDPHAMAGAVRVMEENPRVAAVGFEILTPDNPKPSGKREVEAAKMFIGCGHVLRLKAVREVGGYEVLPGLYGGEEKDLCLRLINRDWKVVKLNGVTVWHEKTPHVRDLRQQRRAGVLNDLSLIWRRCPGAKVWFYLAGNISHQVMFSLKDPRKKLWPSVLGIGEFFFSLPAQWNLRKPVSQESWKKGR
ncbi:MAG: glycosyltransferase [Verrucomicrobia bacterium]|nr:glycosyltransferase [Verrucomicrobiota bacterium]